MSDKNEVREVSFCEGYPRSIIIVRWILLLLAFGWGVYILQKLHHMLAMIYIIYAVLALTLILPLSRCVNCFYYGKLCNTGWGKMASYLFKKSDESKYVEYYSYAIFLHFLWLVPFLIALLQVIRERDIRALSIFLIYAFILLIEKITLKKLCCKRCHQREFCPALPFRKTE